MKRLLQIFICALFHFNDLDEPQEVGDEVHSRCLKCGVVWWFKIYDGNIHGAR